MADQIHHVDAGGDSGNGMGMGMVVGVIVVVLVILGIVLLFGRNFGSAPADTGGGGDVDVPSEINVNLDAPPAAGQ